MKTEEIPMVRFGRTLIAGVLALLFAVGLSLALARLEALAQPMKGTTAADLDLEKMGASVAEPGDSVTYTVSILKGGADPTSAWFTDELPAALNYVPDTLTATDSLGDGVGTFGVENDVITWYASSLGGNVWITFSTQISTQFEGEIVNTAKVTGAGKLVTDTWTTNRECTIFFPLIFKRWPPRPYPPVLSLTGKEDERDDTYTLSWAYSDDSPGVQDPDDYAGDSYTLQEATNSDFSDAETIYKGDAKSYEVTGQEDGTYYYRVRGHNEYGPGEWSNVESTTVQAWSYFDDFSDPDSGWPSLVSETRWAFYEVDSDPPDPHDGSEYPDDGDGYFVARRNNDTPYAEFSPKVAVPSANYEIEVDARFWDAFWGASYQIIFGAGEFGADGDYYALQVRIQDLGDYEGDDWCDYRLFKRVDGDITEFTDSYVGHIDCYERRDHGASPWTHWRIRREGDRIKIYANGSEILEREDGTFGADRYFGVGAAMHEDFTPSKPEFDNFSVELLD